MNDENMFQEEFIEKILGFDINVLTSKGEEKIIRFSDIKTGGSLSSSLSITDDWDIHHGTLDPYIFKVIEVRIECLGYSTTIDKI